MPKPIEDNTGYRVNFRHQGKRYRRRFHYVKYPDAREAAIRFINRVVNGEDAETLSLAEQINNYLNWAERTGKKKASTLRSDRQRLNTFLEWAKQNSVHSADAITIRTIRYFQDYFYANYPLYKHTVRRKTNGATSTWDKYRLILSAFLNWCDQRDLVPKNVLSGNKEFIVKQQQVLPYRIFTPDELNAIFQHLAETRETRVVALFRTLAYTGCRMSEVLRLRWEDIDLSNGVIKVTRETKNKRVRSVPIAKNLRPCLEALAPEHGLVFRNGHGRSYSHDWIYKVLQSTLKACGLPHARLHDFRHTFGATLAQQNVPVPAIKELMGHARLASTQIYIHFAPTHLRAEIDKLGY